MNNPLVTSIKKCFLICDRPLVYSESCSKDSDDTVPGRATHWALADISHLTQTTDGREIKI